MLVDIASNHLRPRITLDSQSCWPLQSNLPRFRLALCGEPRHDCSGIGSTACHWRALRLRLDRDGPRRLREGTGRPRDDDGYDGLRPKDTMNGPCECGRDVGRRPYESEYFHWCYTTADRATDRWKEKWERTAALMRTASLDRGWLAI